MPPGAATRPRVLILQRRSDVESGQDKERKKKKKKSAEHKLASRRGVRRHLPITAARGLMSILHTAAQPLESLIAAESAASLRR